MTGCRKWLSGLIVLSGRRSVREGPRARAFRSVSLWFVILMLAGTVSAAAWNSSGLDLLMTDTPPELENVRIGPDGVIRLAGPARVGPELEDNTVWRIVPGAGEQWYAATGPRGRVYAGGPGPDSRWSVEIEEGDAMAAVEVPGVGLLVGLTPSGRVFRLGPDREPEIVFETGEEYIFDMLAGPDRAVYIATGPSGRLYRFRPGGRGELIYTAPQAHLTCLAWFEPGRTLLAGSSPDGLVYRLELGSGEPRVSVLYDAPGEEVRALAVRADRVYIAVNPGEDGMDPAAVLCVRENGARDWQWNFGEADIYALALSDESPGVIVATGYEGLLYELDEFGRAGIYQHLPAARVISLARTAAGIVAGSSEPARVSLLAPDVEPDRGSTSGWVRSPVQDCAGPAVFGRIEYRARVPSGAGLALDTRTGNSARPDQTWEDWRPVEGGRIRSRPARFIQWQARLSSRFPGRSPTLEQVTIYYATPNRRPQLSSLRFEEIDPAEAARGQARPVRELSWDARDPDQDSLRFTVYYRPEGWDRWLELAAELDEPQIEIDTRALPDGWYRFRVRATDAPSRPPEDALETELESGPALIDNTPPRITGLRLDRDRLRFTVTDEHSVITSARVSVNAGPWLPVGPEDGIFDALEERFSLRLELPPGPAHIAVRATDGQGNSVTGSIRR